MATTATTDDGGPASPPPTKAETLANVLALAAQFSACVEVFQRIHPSKDSSHAQRVALAKLGVQQGRLLIWGDFVGISSPPATIARHMVPSNPGITNPDPTLPVNFGIRDPRLDEPGTSEKVRAALTQITGRPSHLSREELMEKYGLKSPKRFGTVEYPALDTNRLEAFREKYGLLQDLGRQSGVRPPGKGRGMSMTTQHWAVQNVERFGEFVGTVRTEVDGLIALMGVKEQVDRGMRTDIRAMGWHPDLYGPIIRRDWEKLRIIREACLVDYPEYIDVTDTAMRNITEELKGAGLAQPRAASVPAIHISSEPERKKPPNDAGPQPKENEKDKEKEKRPGFLSHFKFRSWGKSTGRPLTSSLSPQGAELDRPRSLSEDLSTVHSRHDGDDTLRPMRSKSLSYAPDNIGSRLESAPTRDEAKYHEAGITIRTHLDEDANPLMQADTAHSMIDRHDTFKGAGRIETKDIRDKAHEAET